MERKVLTLLSFIFLIGLCLFGKTSEVSAATLRLDHAENVYYSRYGNGGPYVSNPHPLYYMDGHVGYCIEPGKEIYSYEYTGNLGMTTSPFSNEINKLIQLIGYYGYEYPGHGTLRYRLATQSLIWEKVSGQTVRYYTERYDEGQEIIVDDEKTEIMRLVNTHTTKPSFKSTNLKGKVGENIVLEDTNHVLDFFEVSKSDAYKAQKNGNQLIITPTKAGTSTITLKKARYDNVSTMVFSPKDPRGQKVAILRFSDEVSLQLKLEAFGSKLKVIKVDAESGTVIKKSGIKFKVKDLSNNSYVCESTSCTFETNNNGEFTTSTYLYGDYELEEVDMMIPDYLWNSNKVKVHIDENKVGSDNVIEIKFTNRRVKGKVVINKIGEKVVIKDDGTLNYEMAPLEGVRFGLYASDNIYQNGILVYKKGTLVKILVTNSKGYVECNNLYLGKYYLKELEAPSGYLVDQNKYEFNLTYQNQYTEVVVKTFNLTNYLQKGKIIINKVGEKIDNNFEYTNIPLKDVKYNLYAGEDIYINKALVYKKDTLIKTLVTDSNGEAEESDLPLGKYYVIEIETLNDYIIDKSKHEFNLTANGAMARVSALTLNLKNNLKTGKIIINKVGEKVVAKDADYLYESMPLENVKYGLYANDDIYINDILIFKKNELIKTLITDSKGTVEISNLPLGKYYLVELETLPDYILDNTKHEFELNEKNSDLNAEPSNLIFKNFLKKGKLVILKNGEDVILENGDYYYQEKPLKGVKYDLYANDDIYTNQVLTYKKGTLIKTIETNDEGMASLDDLPLGKYYIMEIETLDDYVLDDTKYEFTLMDSDKEVMIKTFNLKNHLKKGRLEFLKVDSKTNEPLPKTLIEIYKEVLGDAVLFYRGYTDNNGKITLNDLPLGRYLLKEIESSKGYSLSNEIFTFDITSDGDSEYIMMKNDKIQEVEVPSTALDSNFIFKLAGIFLFLSGGLLIYYSKKKLD